MYAVFYIRDFALQVVSRRKPDLWELPVALLDPEAGNLTQKERGKARILQCTEAARQAGVVCGQTATQGQARCGSLVLIPRDLDAEEEMQRFLVETAGRFSPDIELTGEGLVTLDLHGSLYAYQEEVLVENALEIMGQQALRGSIGMASNPDLAWLAAKLGDPYCKLPQGEGRVRQCLAPLPVDALEPSVELASMFHLWGLRTLGEFLKLPHQEIRERLGEEAGKLHALASGKSRRLLRLLRPPETFFQARSFEDYGIRETEPLLHLMRSFLATLCARLEAVYLVAEKLVLWLEFDHGPPYERTLRLSEPGRNVEMLFRVVETHLETLEVESPVVGCRLEARPARPARSQHHLFVSELKDPNRFAETLARLDAMLEPGRVGRPCVLSTHRPDAFEMEAFQEPPKGGVKSQRFHIGLPLRRYRPPRSVRVVVAPGKGTQVPVAIESRGVEGRICHFEGPWLLSGEWWDQGHWARKEWDVEIENRGLFRLVYQRKKWFLDGVYG